MDRQNLIQAGWKRHSVIEASSELGQIISGLAPEIIQELLKIDKTLIIIITYDCAIVHENLEKEPWLQVAIASRIDIIDTSLAEGRDARRLHFLVSENNVDIPYEVNAIGFYQIERSLLEGHRPSETYSIDAINKRILKIWVSERFRQDTWPDEFVEYLRPAKKRLKNFWKRYTEFVTGMYIHTDSSISPFCLKIILTIEDGKTRRLISHIREKKRNPELLLEDTYKELANELKIALGDGIQILEDSSNPLGVAIEVKSESGLSLRDIRDYGRWSPYAYSGFKEPYPIDAIKR